MQHSLWIRSTESYDLPLAFMLLIILLISDAFALMHQPVVIIHLISVISVQQGCAHWSEAVPVLWINAGRHQLPTLSNKFTTRIQLHLTQLCGLKIALSWLEDTETEFLMLSYCIYQLTLWGGFFISLELLWKGDGGEKKKKGRQAWKGEL